MADAEDSKSSGVTPVGVRPPLPAPVKMQLSEYPQDFYLPHAVHPIQEDVPPVFTA